MARLSFKDVGIKASDTLYKSPEEQNKIPIGIKTPLEIDYSDSGAIFKMHYNLTDQISDNLRNLILTNQGERLGFPDFGANIRPLLTEYPNKENFDTIVMSRIKNAASKYMPYINLIAYESKIDTYENRYTAVIKMLLIYSVPNANIEETAMEVTLFVI